MSPASSGMTSSCCPQTDQMRYLYSRRGGRSSQADVAAPEGASQLSVAPPDCLDAEGVGSRPDIRDVLLALALFRRLGRAPSPRGGPLRRLQPAGRGPRGHPDALSALAMGLQANAIRSLHVPSISTTAFTATFIDVFSGLVTWSLTAYSARRLAASMVGMAAGAFLSDWMLSHAHPYAPVVPAVITAVVIAIPWVVLKPRATSDPAGTAGSEVSGRRQRQPHGLTTGKPHLLPGEPAARRERTARGRRGPPSGRRSTRQRR